MKQSVLLLLFSAACATAAKLNVGGLTLTLFDDTFTVQRLNQTDAAKQFSFVPKTSSGVGCHNLGDITLRVRAVSEPDAAFTYYTSANPVKVTPLGTGGNELLKHDITAALNATVLPAGSTPAFAGVPLRVTRSYEKSAAGGFVVRFNVKNTLDAAVEIGGLGMAMPATNQSPSCLPACRPTCHADCKKKNPGIEQSVWNDPHIGADHGFVEWVRVVAGEKTMVAVPTTLGEGFEAWRPIMENTCGGHVWELNTHSLAWAEEWATNKQWPYYYMSEKLNKTGTWPNPKSPWPAWHAHDTIPVTDFSGIAQPWNAPTSRTLQPKESMSVSVHFKLAEAGPRTRDDALASLGTAVMHAVPGYVLTPELTTAKLFVTSRVAKVTKVTSSDEAVVTVELSGTEINVQAIGGGRARVSVSFDDGSVATAHYGVPSSASFAKHVALVGSHWANDAWLPRDFIDPFGRSASVMPYDRENREHVLDDSRAYDVGLSDDAGGGNPLGFAMKVGHAPLQEEVGRLDEYIQWTLYGIKTDTAKPPFKSLQIRPEDHGDTDGIRMTMYYYDNAAHPSNNNSGHFPYDYKEQPKCRHYGIEGGPNWCMSEYNANSTGRTFNFPHHCATYYAMYRVARYHTSVKVRMPWQWYLGRAANTTAKFGSHRPKTGVMDGTLFREVLRSLDEEAGEDAEAWKPVADQIRADMLNRTENFAAQEYPYGSEFGFDTTGQEEVVIWLSHFASSSNDYEVKAKKTVDHILSYMRSSPTWPYNGGTRSWGDVGNGGKWMPSIGTRSTFETRGNLHYRSGLNAIPLIEWFRSHPDDYFLLEIAMGAQAGQMMNIDDKGAPSMMLHMLPHILDFDPHSADFGLGFFGHTLEAGSYFVRSATLGQVCFLCDLSVAGSSAASGADVAAYTPRDSYKIRTYIEPLGLYLQLDAGTFKKVVIDFDAKTIKLVFSLETSAATFITRRLRVEKVSDARPGTDFKLVQPASAKVVRSAYEFPASVIVAELSWN